MKRAFGLSLTLALLCAFTSTSAETNSPISIQLGIDGTPTPGVPFSLTCTLSTDLDNGITGSVVLNLEPGLVTESGESSIQLEEFIWPDSPSIVTTSVVASQEDIYQVEGLLSAVVDNDYIAGAQDLVYVQVSSKIDEAGMATSSGEVSEEGFIFGVECTEAPGGLTYDFEHYTPIEGLDVESIPDRGEGNDAIYGGPAKASINVVVSGEFCYRNPDGYRVPLVNAHVEVWDDDNFLCGGDDLLGTGVTDAMGQYAITVDNGDCSGGADIYVVVKLENSRVAVKDPEVTGATYSYKLKTATFDDVGSNLFVGVYCYPDNTYSQRAAWVFDSLNRAWSTMRSYTGYQMRWQLALVGHLVDLSGSTSFNPSTNVIYVESGDAQSFDIVVHEYGHSVHDWFGDIGGNSCPSPHYFQSAYNQDCAWDEGFADFLPVALNNDGEFNWNPYSYIDIESGTSTLNNKTHSEALSTEGNVAMALYDLFDSGYEPAPGVPGRDGYSGGLEPILDVLNAYSVQGSFQTFWNRWVIGNPRHLPVLAIRLNRINFNTPPTWTEIPYAILDVGDEYILDVGFHVSDFESTDDELILTVHSNTNNNVYYNWLSGNRLRMINASADGTGSTEVRLRADDELVAVVSSAFRITWREGGYPPGGKEEPPKPCIWPCATSAVAGYETALGPNSPNPFNPTTQIPYSIDKRQDVSLKVYNVEGKLVRVLFAEVKEPGVHQALWDGRDSHGRAQASGIYFAVLETEERTFTRKMMLLK